MILAVVANLTACAGKPPAVLAAWYDARDPCQLTATRTQAQTASYCGGATGVQYIYNMQNAPVGRIGPAR